MHHPPKKQPKRKKPRLGAVLLLLMLVLAAAFVVLLPAIRKAFPQKQLDYEIVHNTVRTLDTRDAAQITRIHIYPDGQNGYELRMQDGTMHVECGGEWIAVAQDDQKKILEAVTVISVQDTVTEDDHEGQEQLSAMGLDVPQCRAEVEYADGSREVYEVGGRIPGGTDYYFRWSGAKGIYTCHSGVLEAFTVAPNLLIPLEQPTIYSALVEKIVVENANGVCSMAFELNGSGKLTGPVVYPMTADTAQTMLAAAQNVRLGAYEAELTKENCAAYGFDSPLCTIRISLRGGMTNVITDAGTLGTAEIEGQELVFVIGREEGEFFYTCAYQGRVYLVSRFLLQTLTETDWKTLLSRTPLYMDDALLSCVVFETPDKTAEIRIMRTESVLANNELERDADGNVVWLTTVEVDGQKVPQEWLEELLKRLQSFAAEGDIPAGAAADEEPRWRVTLVSETGDVRVVEGHRLDVFSDAVAVDGVMCHYVYDEAIDVLMSGLE